MQLFEKFYNADAGEIWITGANGVVNIKDLPASKWRQMIGYVGQEPVLFKGSIYDNITCRDPSASYDDVVWACRTAEALDFIRAKGIIIKLRKIFWMKVSRMLSEEYVYMRNSKE